MAAPDALMPDAGRLALLTDLYELTMAAGYHHSGLAVDRGTFELFVRSLPERRNYLVAAGLEQAIDYLLQLHFTDEDISYLRAQAVFRHASDAWFEALRALRFTGDVWAVPEGTVVFAQEPLMQVTAPVMEAQIVETCLLTSLAFQTSVASKAARVVGAARGRGVVDFGSRRAHGPQAGLLAARGSFIGGCRGTSNVLAAQRLGITPVGTMAHSWVMAFEDEEKAFAEYARVFPENAIFLIDTYDTVEGARRAVSCGAVPAGVRLDSGDIDTLSRQVRDVLEQAGFQSTRIFVSGDMNEYKIDKLTRAGAPIDAFGVGTELVTSKDAPALGAVYKLVEFFGTTDHVGRIKLSEEKKTYPYRKQVFRRRDDQGRFQGDVIGRHDEALEGEPLLQQVMAGGRLIAQLPTLEQSQQRCHQQVSCLPEELLDIEGSHDYPVAFSPLLEQSAAELAEAWRASLRR